VKKPVIAVIGLFVLMYILPLGVRSLVIPDETRYAEIPREMLASGEWIVPHLAGVRYFEKPPMGYWLGAVSLRLFGENNFAVRLPSAIATGISALLLLLLVRRFGRGAPTAVLAAAIFLTSVEVFAVGVYAVLDAVLTMFLTAAIVSFYFAYKEDDARRSAGYLALFGAATGFAFLTKGFLALAVLAVTIVPFIAWEGGWKRLFKLAWVPLIAVLLTTLPWGVMIHLREPRFWDYFLWTEHIRRFASDSAQHPEPFWFYLPYLIVGALPWTVLAPAAISRMRRSSLADPLGRLAVCWITVPFFLFSLSAGKLGTYILPCYPPLAVLVAMGLRRYLDEKRKLLFAVGVVPLALAAVVGAVIVLSSQLTDFPGFRVYSPAETWKWIVGCAILMMSSAGLLIAAGSVASGRRLASLCAAPLLIMCGSQFLIPDQFKEKKTPGPFLVEHADRVGTSTILVSEAELAVAACWYYRRADVYLVGGTGELAWGFTYDDAENRLLTESQLGALIAGNGDRNSVTLFAYRTRYEDYRDRLPTPRFIDTYGRFVLVQF
jgi:4-amino-4-deoxy-L-arabinose transferase